MLGVGFGATGRSVASGTCVRCVTWRVSGCEHLEPYPDGAARANTVPLHRWLQEVSHACHYHADTFPNCPINDVIVVGAAANHFFLNDAAATKIYTLSLHDALPI